MKKMVLLGGLLTLGPLLAATIRDNKEAIGQARQGQLEPPEMLELTCTLATAAAQRVDPSITRDQVENIVDMENFDRVFAACWGVSLPELAPGEPPQAVPPSPST